MHKRAPCRSRPRSSDKINPTGDLNAVIRGRSIGRITDKRSQLLERSPNCVGEVGLQSWIPLHLVKKTNIDRPNSLNLLPSGHEGTVIATWNHFSHEVSKPSI
jgi:hypothetical protein